MNKKSFNKITVKKSIIESRANGKTDQEIYNELTQKYYDKKGIALFIPATATIENKNKYKLYNDVLLGAIGVVILLKIITIFSLSLASGQMWALLFIFIVPLMNIYFFYEIARYNGQVYRICGMLTIAGFLQSISKLETGFDFLLTFIFTAVITGLSFYLDAKMFPNYKPTNLKKDNNGEYIINQ